MSRQGKIASLPFRLRKQVNDRLRDGQKAPKILAWLNTEPEAIAVWEEDFEGAPCTEQNLSEWRRGGYRDYLREREKLDHLEALTDFAREVADRAKGDLADGAAAILTGQIVSGFEALAEEGGMPLDKAAAAVANLRSGDVAKGRLDLAKEKHRLSEKRLELDRQKFERATCEAVLKAAKSPEIQAILSSGKSKTIQLELLHEQLFGKRPA
jgi:hypothetical protein